MAFQDIYTRLLLSLSYLPLELTSTKKKSAMQELSEKLHISYGTFCARRSRGSVPYDYIIDYCKKYNISSDWIFLGREKTAHLKMVGGDEKNDITARGVFEALDEVISLKVSREEQEQTREAYRMYIKNKAKDSCISRNSIPYKKIIELCDRYYLSVDSLFKIKDCHALT